MRTLAIVTSRFKVAPSSGVFCPVSVPRAYRSKITSPHNGGDHEINGNN